MSWSEDNVKVEASKYFGPPSLAASKLLGGHKVFEVTVVCIHNGVESVWIALQVVPPFFE
jgi:hypothetical protein